LKTLNAMTDEGFVVADSLKELSDMAEVRAALQNLCAAAQLAAPWNFSFAVLDAFLRATSNMDAELKDLKKAPIVASFIDHVLQVNAANWLSDADFLDMPALKALWESWWCARRGSLRAEAAATQGGQQAGQQQGGNNKQNANGGNQGEGGGKMKKKGQFNRRGGGSGGQPYGNNGGGGGQQGGGQGSGYQAFGGQDGMRQPTLYVAPPSEKNLCRKFNDGNCPNHYSRCSFMGRYGPVKLYHFCNYLKRENNEQKPCMERHARVDHK
jgi:hypothetical protein